MKDSASQPPRDPARDSTEPTPADLDLIDAVATKVVSMRMSVPAILFVESSKPLSFVGSQFLYFFEPIVRTFVKGDQFARFAALLEDRNNVELLLSAIEQKEAESQERERLARAAGKQRKAEAKARRKKKEESKR